MPPLQGFIGSGMAPIDYPRDAAVNIITSVLSERRFLDTVIEPFLEKHPPAARAWLQEICSGVLRWKGRIDLAIDENVSKKKPSGWLRKVLMLTAYQVIAQERISPSVVVSEAVEIIKKKEGKFPAGFANAVLRRIVERRDFWSSTNNSEGYPKAAWLSLPGWMLKKMVQQHGDEWTDKYAISSLNRPQLWMRSLHEDFHVKSGAGWVEKGPLPFSYKILEHGPVSLKPGFSTGEFFIQDISNQLLVHEVSEFVKKNTSSHSDNTNGISVLDICASPGGKAVGMAWEGFKVFATDKNPDRLSLLKATADKLSPSAVKVIPFEEVNKYMNQDLVWVDAPCSGTGILRRHPEIRWLREEKEIEELVKVQAHLIDVAWGLVKPGGFLVYSVCSVLSEEGREAVERFRREGQLAKEWFLAPHEGIGGDGFYAALAQRI